MYTASVDLVKMELITNMAAANNVQISMVCYQCQKLDGILGTCT